MFLSPADLSGMQLSNRVL